MLMTDDNLTEDRLTEHGEKLLAIIRSRGGEIVTRSDIAKALDKTRLNVWDVALLDKMAGQGMIEATKRKIKSPIGYEWVYRAKQS
jgi:hypothetical protein